MGCIRQWACGLLVMAFGASAAAGQPAQKFDFQDLLAILRNNKDIRSVDQLIPKLPASYRHHYVLSYHSPSRQGGEAESPRVIAFGAPREGASSFEDYYKGIPSTRNDYLLMAWKSDPAVKVGHVPEEDDLEVFEYIPRAQGQNKESSWVARDIIFPNRASDRTDLADSERFVVSEDNPKDCRSCHRHPEMRPNWEPYPRWPGFIGSKASPYASGSEEKQEYLAEQAAVKLFNEKIKDLPRLKMMDKFATDEKSTEARNIDMTAKVGEYNFKRVLRIIKESPLYAKYKYAMVAAMRGCDDFPSFISEATRSKLDLDYAQVTASTRAAMSRQDAHFGVFERELNREVVAVANLRYLFEGVGGEDSIDYWFMNFRRNQYRLNAVGGHIFDRVGSDLWQEVRKGMKDVEINMYDGDFPKPGTPSYSGCEALRKKSLEVQR